jgi:hypothetical protein
MVGISQKIVTTDFVYTSIRTYFNDFFPNFTDHDPWKEPEYFKYPYKHVTLDFLMFVYQYHDRLKLLEEADERGMNIREFLDWAKDKALDYNIEVGKQIYEIKRHSFSPYIKKI